MTDPVTVTDPVSDPMNPVIDGFIKPDADQIAAQKSRNLAIAGALVFFVVFVIVLMLYKLGLFTK